MTRSETGKRKRTIGKEKRKTGKKTIQGHQQTLPLSSRNSEYRTIIKRGQPIGGWKRKSVEERINVNLVVAPDGECKV